MAFDPETYVYLDYAATAPLCEEAARAMAPYQEPGRANLAMGANANSLHGPRARGVFGPRGRAALARARLGRAPPRRDRAHVGSHRGGRRGPDRHRPRSRPGPPPAPRRVGHRRAARGDHGHRARRRAWPPPGAWRRRGSRWCAWRRTARASSIPTGWPPPSMRARCSCRCRRPTARLGSVQPVAEAGARRARGGRPFPHRRGPGPGQGGRGRGGVGR